MTSGVRDSIPDAANRFRCGAAEFTIGPCESIVEERVGVLLGLQVSAEIKRTEVLLDYRGFLSHAARRLQSTKGLARLARGVGVFIRIPFGQGN